MDAPRALDEMFAAAAANQNDDSDYVYVDRALMRKAEADADALVARVTDLEAEVTEKEREKDKLHDWGSEWKVRAREAEAQVATMQGDVWAATTQLQAAEAALATTRQALARIADGAQSNPPHEVAEVARRALAATEKPEAK